MWHEITCNVLSHEYFRLFFAVITQKNPKMVYNLEAYLRNFEGHKLWNLVTMEIILSGN